MCTTLLTGCGTVSGLVGDRDQRAEPRLAKVMVLVPGRAAEAAEADRVTAAVRQVLDDLAVPGWTVEVEHADDGGDATGARRAAQQIAADHDVIAVVGGLSAASVRAAQPELDRARIPFLSPADEAVEHTRGADPARPQRPYDSYFRVAVPDVGPGEFAAEYAVLGLGAGTVAVIQDGRPAEAAAFTRQARQLGAEVVTAAPGDIGDGIKAARAADARAVFVAGDGAFAAAVAAAVANRRLDTTVIGGAELQAGDFLTAAGPAAEGVVSITPAALAPSVDMPVGGVIEAGRYGAAAVDAATALAEVLERCLPAVRDGPARTARRGCASELGTVSFDGVTGAVSFDAFGERPGALPRAFVMAAGEWLPAGHQ